METTTAPTAEQIETAFQSFVKKADAQRREYLTKQYPNSDHGFLSVDPTGKRYWRVVTNDGPSHHVFCFVDKTNGNVLKAASWKAPAKHARGNVLNPDNGMGGVSIYGGVYLR